MLSVDQVLRLISLPAVLLAFVIASHIAVAVNAPAAPAQIASE